MNPGFHTDSRLDRGETLQDDYLIFLHPSPDCNTRPSFEIRVRWNPRKFEIKVQEIDENSLYGFRFDKIDELNNNKKKNLRPRPRQSV